MYVVTMTMRCTLRFWASPNISKFRVTLGAGGKSGVRGSYSRRRRRFKLPCPGPVLPLVPMSLLVTDRL